MLTILAIMATAIAKADTVDVKVKNFIVTEVNDIKEYQQASWQAGKEQNAKNVAKIKSFFTNLIGKNDG
jgi:hypothetical protein